MSKLDQSKQSVSVVHKLSTTYSMLYVILSAEGMTNLDDLVLPKVWGALDLLKLQLVVFHNTDTFLSLSS
jgi:hypothetical protein